MLDIKTKVTGAAIYRNGAEIIREGNVHLPAGTERIRIAGLSAGSVADTMRMYLPEGVTCADIRVFYDEENPLSDEISGKIEELKRNIEVRELQASLWKDNGDFRSRSTLQISEISEYIRSLPEKLQELQMQNRKDSQEIKKLEKELNEAVRTGNLPVIQAEITSPAEQDCRIRIVCQDQNAMWEPVYEVHADTQSDTEIRIRARIMQWTGEEWQNAAVTLRTGNPSAAAVMPELKPVYLNLRPKAAPVYMRQAMTMGMSMAANAMMDTAAGATAKMARVETEEAVSEQQETMTEYTLPQPRNIVSSTDGTMADLQKFSLKAEYLTAAVPALSSAAYRTAVLKTEDLPAVISGEASVYLNGIYTGKTYLNPDLNRETFEIPLGREESIHLARKKTNTRKASAFLKNQKTTDHAYEITVTNSQDKAAEVRIMDQIPVSQDKTITVEAQNISGAALDEQTGILTWNLKLGPRETKTLNLAYKVSLPKDEELQETYHSRRTVCPSCGYELEDGYRPKFCPNCGAVL